MKSFKKNIYRTINDDCVDCIAHDVIIDSQTWTGCNANTKFYNNGDPIPYVDNSTTWSSLTTGAWCYYNNDSSNESTYGILYNWYAINDPRGIAPVGYHVPTDTEWTTLTTFLGGDSVAGGKMKETGVCHWTNPNIDATNTSLFTALPGGFRNSFGNYNNITNYGDWWSSTEVDPSIAWSRNLFHGTGNAYRVSPDKKSGLSLRFIKD